MDDVFTNNFSDFRVIRSWHHVNEVNCVSKIKSPNPNVTLKALTLTFALLGSYSSDSYIKQLPGNYLTFVVPTANNPEVGEIIRKNIIRNLLTAN